MARTPPQCRIDKGRLWGIYANGATTSLMGRLREPDSAADTVFAGDDKVVGGLGDDYFDGGLGNDKLTGHGGSDMIDGGDFIQGDGILKPGFYETFWRKR